MLVFALVTEQLTITAPHEAQPHLNQANGPAAQIVCFPASVMRALPKKCLPRCCDGCCLPATHPLHAKRECAGCRVPIDRLRGDDPTGRCSSANPKRCAACKRMAKLRSSGKSNTIIVPLGGSSVSQSRCFAPPSGTTACHPAGASRNSLPVRSAKSGYTRLRHHRADRRADDQHARRRLRRPENSQFVESLFRISRKTSVPNYAGSGPSCWTVCSCAES